jgi:hypothetical protein
MMFSNAAQTAPANPPIDSIASSHVRLVPTGARQWAVVNNGRILAVVDNQQDGMTLASGLLALEHQPAKDNYIQNLVDLVEDLKAKLEERRGLNANPIFKK